tara:strand:- start:5355 stop:6602 length:1248 start_codon:yes stop_codon:yes gene_type:complete
MSIPVEGDITPNLETTILENTTDNTAHTTSSNEDNNCDKFERMDLKKGLLRGIFSYGYEIPSAIQRSAIPKFLTGKDLIAQAQSGTGKTATFSISLIQKIDDTYPSLQALIISPTRELSEQIYTVFLGLSKYTKIKVALFLGGQPRKEQINTLRDGVHCVICTPGRINDLIQNGYVNMNEISTVVLDEADELLTDAFINQIRRIISYLPQSTQVCLFSATMPDGCLKIAHRFTNDANFLTIKREQLTLEGISQYYITTENDKIKYDTISDLYETIIINQLMIYCNTKQRVMYLTDNLKQDGFACSCIHSDLTTNERMDIMQKFRNGQTRVLISTDLLARGIDVQQVSLVINYDIPKNAENYIHRIGRSGRYGRKGIALNFICRYDVAAINHIEKFYETEIKELPANIDAVFNQIC